MPTDSMKRNIQDAYRTLSRNIEGFRVRPAQTSMIGAIAKTIAPDDDVWSKIAVIEGQTGTGKSIGYLIGAIPVAQELEKTLVISTATVALQEQLIEKDLPLVSEKAGLDFSYRIAKGRRRYLCPRNLADLTGSNQDQAILDLGEEHEGSAVWARPPKEGEVETVTKMEKQFNAQLWSGDFDEWESEVDPELKAMASTNNSGCSGRNCRFASRCPFYEARADLKETDVVIANHDLVLADLELGGGVILNDPEESIYVFDEAHHLPDKAIGHFAHQSSLKGVIKALDSSKKSADKAASLLATGDSREKAQVVDHQLKETRELVNRLRKEFSNTFPKEKSRGRFQRTDEDRNWRFPHGKTPEAFVEPAAEIALNVLKVMNTIDALRDKLKTALKDGKIANSGADQLIQNLGNDTERCRENGQAWQKWAQREDPEALPMARWIAQSAQDQDHFTIACSAISAAAMLQSMLWKRAYACILTSATITALNSFQRFQRACGLRGNDGTLYLQLASPFNYSEVGEVEVPWTQSDPSDPQSHTQEVAQYINNCVDENAGTLVLFSSASQMKEVAKQLRDDLKQRCLIQNERSKAEILSEHEQVVRQGQGSMIFGLASFSEGVDLPGDLCVHVIIAKLPFAVPDTPVEAARAEWLESKGYNPFMEITVPDASLKLVQAVGRLIRSESDRGKVTILDRRLITKRYGKQLLASLPPLRRNIGGSAQPLTDSA